MTNQEIIELVKKAISNTYAKYDDKQAFYALYYILKDGNTEFVTNENEDRTKLKEIDPNMLKKAIIQEYISVVMLDYHNSRRADNTFDLAVIKTYEKYKDRKDIGKVLTDCVFDCLEKGENRLTRDNGARAWVNKEAKSKKMTIKEYATCEISKRLYRNMEKEFVEPIRKRNPITNVDIYGNNVNKLRSAIISGLGIKQEGTVSIGNEMYAASSIGRARKTQEDAVLLMTHPKNPKFKMMVVADGMGGMKSGEIASDMTVEEIKKWFETLDPSFYENSKALQKEYIEELRKINQKIYSRLHRDGGTTFVGAIVAENETVMVNIGDSRGYMLSDGKLIQITKDQTPTELIYRIPKEEQRFHYKSNEVIEFLGDKEVYPNSYIIDNELYDAILLFSDGVTDCLTDEDILVVTKTTNREDLAKAIVNKALNTTQIAPDKLKGNPKFVTEVKPGKDNATVATYIKKNDDEKNDLIQ